METPPPARPDVDQHVVPPPHAESSGRTIAIVVAAVLGALVMLALIIIIAVAFIGRSASSQFEQIGNCVDKHGNTTICASGFPNP